MSRMRGANHRLPPSPLRRRRLHRRLLRLRRQLPPHEASNMRRIQPRRTSSSVARVFRESNLERAAPLKAIDTYGDFLSRLQAALRTDDRRAVSRLVGFPLSVRKDGKVETYRSRREVERDFDEIFTPRVRSEVLDQRPYSLRTRQDGKTKGSTRIWFAPACFNAQCNSSRADPHPGSDPLTLLKLPGR